MKKFFKGLLAILLILIIVGGIGYIGYSYYYMNPSMVSAGGQANASGQDQQSTQHGVMSGQTQTNNPEALEAIRAAMANKDSLDISIAALNEALSYMTLDPYSPSDNNEDMNSMNGMQMPQSTPSNNTTQGNTTINIYPGTNSTQQSSSMPSMTMTDMGTAYDQNKMEQLHSGLYKLSVGMKLLGQLSDELAIQAEYANKDIQNPVQFYSNQYTLGLQNKNKLNNALMYINEASSLVNINPYISENGLVYDKDRMKKIHESIYKMAEVVVTLNKLSSEMSLQAVNIANAAQSYMSNGNIHASMSTMNNETSNLFSGIFNNTNMSTIVNIILILFVTMFILGLLGYIFSLMKTSSKSNNSGINN